MYQEHPGGFAPGLGLHSEEIPYACQNHFNGYCGKNHAHQSLDRNQSTFFDETSERRAREPLRSSPMLLERQQASQAIGPDHCS